MRRSLGMLLLGIWLVLTGLISLFGLALPYSGIIMGLLALVAGIAIIAGR
jgi:hypothetical protein